MKTRISTHTGFCLLFALGLSLHAFSQRQTLVGVNVNSEIYPGQFKPVVGLSIEKQLTRHSGVESGVFYRTQKSSGIITYTDAAGPHTYSFRVSQRHLNVPVLYKYYSGILNVSLGPTVDFYLGWKQKDRNSPAKVQSYNVTPAVQLGFLAKASKVISLNKQFLVEPELRYSAVHVLDETGLGIGIAVKYRLGLSN